MAFAFCGFPPIFFVSQTTRAANQLKIVDGMLLASSQLICLFCVDFYHWRKPTRNPSSQALKFNINASVFPLKKFHKNSTLVWDFLNICQKVRSGPCSQAAGQ